MGQAAQARAVKDTAHGVGAAQQRPAGLVLVAHVYHTARLPARGGRVGMGGEGSGDTRDDVSAMIDGMRYQCIGGPARQPPGPLTPDARLHQVGLGLGLDVSLVSIGPGVALGKRVGCSQTAAVAHTFQHGASAPLHERSREGAAQPEHAVGVEALPKPRPLGGVLRQLLSSGSLIRQVVRDGETGQGFDTSKRDFLVTNQDGAAFGTRLKTIAHKHSIKEKF